MRTVLVVLAALAVAAIGVVRLIWPESSAATTTTEQANVDSLSVQVTDAGWTEMDHDMSQPGYQMPSQMMPGMPENGDQRLAVAVTVVNSSNATKPLVPAEEFTLHAGKDGKKLSPQGDNFGELSRLAPGNAVKGILFFDLPPAQLGDSPAWIEWTRDDQTSRITLPLDGAAPHPDHSH